MSDRYTWEPGDVTITPPQPFECGGLQIDGKSIEDYSDEELKSKLQKAEANLSSTFTMTNPWAIQAAQRDIGQLIVAISGSTLAAIRQLIATAFAEGITPRETAKMIEQFIGMTPKQTLRVMKLRQLIIGQTLSSLQSKGMAPERAMSLATARGDEVALKLARKTIHDRAALIARTETIAASSMGTGASFQQAANDGLVDAAVMGQIWIATDDARTCPQCRARNGMVVRFGQTWDGLTIPAHPACRCRRGMMPLDDQSGKQARMDALIEHLRQLPRGTDIGTLVGAGFVSKAAQWIRRRFNA